MAERTISIIRAGFMALTDCAPIVVARELEFDRRFGIHIEPVRLPSWAAIRDHLAFEKLECAHMLGGLSLAMHLGLGGMRTEMTVPLMLGRGGNAITLSSSVYDEALALMAGRPVFNRAESAAMLKPVVAARKLKGERPLRLAMVHAFSSHNYELRAWLAHGGIDPDHDVELSVVPPPRMVEALRNGLIDGYCVGEPWSQVAVEEGLGRIMATKADLYPNSPEKVLALRRPWAIGHADMVSALVEAFSAAMSWAAQTENRTELAYMLSRPAYLNVDHDVILHGLMCAPRLVPGDMRQPIDDYLSFGGTGCGYPAPGTALWLLAQMRRWGQAGAGHEAEVAGVFDPSYIERNVNFSGERKFQFGRRAKQPPFDGVAFDDKDIEAYWRQFAIAKGA
ncbi:MAG: ABC transporter substrate-binding protein [Alphaproteobacteria bacterium]|nr:MAG: ABC transporter substrate-binding protein [Alphaproteobacteria bacterium]